jgi:hypothetical protein
LVPEKQVCELIDAIWKSGVKSSSEISRVIERNNGIEILPHFIAEYKYRKRHNEEIREDFFDFEKEKLEQTETVS